MFSYLSQATLMKSTKIQMVYTEVNKNRYNWEQLMNSPTLSITKFYENVITYYHNLFMFIIDMLLEL